MTSWSAGTLGLGPRAAASGSAGAGVAITDMAGTSITSARNTPRIAVNLNFFDFYRLKNSTELFDIGWQDYLNDNESIIFIEWGKRFPSVLPTERIEINVSVINGTEREFSFEKFN